MMKFLWVCIVVAFCFSKWVDGFLQYSHRGDPKTEIINNTLMVSITLIRGAEAKGAGTSSVTVSFIIPGEFNGKT